MPMDFEYDSRDYWKNRARIRQGVIDQLRRKLGRANERIAELEAADEPDGAPMHAWEVTEGWRPRRENLHDEHNAERWPR